MSDPTAWTPAREAAGGRLVDRLDRLVHPVERFFAFVSALCIFGLMMIGVVQIVARRVFNAPIFGYIDMVELSISIFAFLAIAYCERLSGHVRMELFVGRMRGRLLWSAEIFGQLIALFVVGVLIYFGWDHAMRAYNFGDSTIDAEYPWWPSKMLVALAFLLLWFRILVNLIGYGRLFLAPDAPPIAVPLVADVKRLAEAEAAEAGALEAAEEAANEAERIRRARL